MLAQSAKVFGVLGLLSLCLLCREEGFSQEPVVQPIPVQNAETPKVAEGAEVPKGVEVQARGPVHEAFATPTSEAKATPTFNKKPPLPIEEMPPDEKPEGDVTWIGGYWAWDDDRSDYLWVSGCWRTRPQGKDWVPGYWREQGTAWQWVPGFWRNVGGAAKAQEVTYYPEPPAPPNMAPPGEAPAANMLYVPGYWSWGGERYVWRAGYWTQARSGWVYVNSHYRWSPAGYVFVSGYWDYSLARRGVLYAPIIVDTVVVGPRFVYTPYYAVTDTIMLDAFFIRPAYCHYYFGDYYGPRYRTIGFESTVVYSRRYHDSIIVTQRWEYRDNPRWYDSQVNIVIARDAGRAPVPPRTLVQQTTIINNVTNVTNVTNVNNVYKTPALAPAKTVVASRGGKTVALAAADRVQAKESTQSVQQAALKERVKTETVKPGGQPATKPHTASLNVPTLPASVASSNPGGTTTKGPGTPNGGLGKGGTTTPATKTSPDIGKNPIGTPGTKTSPDIGKNPIGTPGDPALTRDSVGKAKDSPAKDSASKDSSAKDRPTISNPRPGGTGTDLTRPKTGPGSQPMRDAPKKDDTKKKGPL